MATVKVKFRPSTVADRPGSIIIIVTNHRVVRQITTGYKVFPCEWDEKQSQLVSTVENGRMAAIKSITQRLCWDVERLHGIIERLDSRQRGYSTDDVVSEFQRTGKENTFFIFMENVIVRLSQLGHTGTANNYRAALGSFKRFRAHEDIPIGAIDHVIMEDYQAYLNAAGSRPIPHPFTCASSGRSITVRSNRNQPSTANLSGPCLPERRKHANGLFQSATSGGLKTLTSRAGRTLNLPVTCSFFFSCAGGCHS